MQPKLELIGLSFKDQLIAVIRDMHPEYSEDTAKNHVATLFNASQCFPDEDGEMEDAAKAQVISCLKIWRAYDYR